MPTRRDKLMWTPAVNVEITTLPDGRVRARVPGKELFRPTPEEAMRAIEQEMVLEAQTKNF